jgi:acetyltransferase
MAADELVCGGGTLATLAPQTVERLDALLPATWSRGNPVDLIGDAPVERYVAALQASLALHTQVASDHLPAVNRKVAPAAHDHCTWGAQFA